MARRIGQVCMILFAAMTAGPAPAADPFADPSALCEEAAAKAAAESGVPLPILDAILLAESGRGRGAGVRPWPWTLHATGRGQWFDSRTAAEAELRHLASMGLTNIDIGCFQINLRWHGAAYPSPEMLLDPLTNARHAAAFLTELHRDSLDWRQAAGRYHSRDPHRAEGYAQRLEQLHADAKGGPAAAPAPIRRARAVAGPIIDFARRVRPLVGGAP